MGEKNVPQPDATLRILSEYGGQSQVEGDYPVGAPELIAEVAASSLPQDLGVKMKLYERMGVRDYLIADTRSRRLHWKELDNGQYLPLEPGADGVFRSRQFPGLWLDEAALWTIDLPRLFAVVQQGLATPDHADFVARLAATRG
jgi:Uma2 family endonuclease